MTVTLTFHKEGLTVKKRWIQLALILGLMTLTCVAAQATDAAPTSGFKNVSVVDDYKSVVSLSPLDALDKDVIDRDTPGTYPGAVKVGVTYTGSQKDSEYLLIALVDGQDTTPTADNMAYIDQKTGDGSNLKFNIYPKKTTESSVTYSVYMSSNAEASASGVTGYVKVGSFEYYNAGLDFTLGDVDDNGKINVSDAVLVLQAYVGKKELTDAQTAAADVDKNEKVNVSDAVKILQYYVGKITSFG